MQDIDDANWSQPPLHEDGKAFEVAFRVNMTSIAAVDTVNYTTFVKLSIVFHWFDPRLREWAQQALLPKGLWGPYIVFENALSSIVMSQVEFILLDQGASPGLCKRTLKPVLVPYSRLPVRLST